MGFADIYEHTRPTVPDYPIKIITQYLGKTPDNVVDLGCGTGLSTLAWENKCKHVTGIEPSPDMINISKTKETKSTTFITGFGNDTGLSDMYADVVVCSQSFHWMEPMSTLKEIDRILKFGGVFATIDCDWPPVTQWQAEKAFSDIYNYIKELEVEIHELNDSFVRYPKDKHLDNIRNSGYFRYCREITFSNTELCTEDRFAGLLLSQGSTQLIMKNFPETLNVKIKEFRDIIHSIFKEYEFNIDFSYKMRIAVK